jgi:hypothetical protein
MRVHNFTRDQDFFVNVHVHLCLMLPDAMVS